METIAAISTATGSGGIGIIRMSGEKSFEILEKIFEQKKKQSIEEIKGYTIKYGNIVENGEVVDEVLVSYFKAPKSYTTENMCEINSHGGIVVERKILEECLKNGAELAEPGEFTKRAFLNGRIDLIESEAVMNLINVKNEKSRKIAINNLKGSTTNQIKKLREKILKILTNIEVNIDYPEYHDIEVLTIEKLKKELITIEQSLDKLIENSKVSKLLTNGINVAIIGRPNVGKSSILNKLIEEDKAIVTDIPGTTRDIVEAGLNIDGITLNLIDTAGIRETEDIVEKIGVEKSKEIIEKSDLILLVLNNNEKLTKEDEKLLELSKNKLRIIVVNKSDLDKKLEINLPNTVYTNTIDDEGLSKLIEKIKELFNLDQIETDDFYYISNINQVKKIENTKNSIKDIKEGLENNIPIDMLEIDLKNIWQTLGEVIGETYTEELLDNLFKDFCVGK